MRVHRRAVCVRHGGREHQAGERAVPRCVAPHGHHVQPAALKRSGQVQQRVLLARIAERTGQIAHQNRAVAAVLKKIAQLRVVPCRPILLG